jgi:hypothetical protein
MQVPMGKYDSLGEYLRKQRRNEIPMTFDRIEKITGTRLPRSATFYRAWWSNNASNSVMTQVWLDAGFQSEQVDMKGRKLVFRRVRPSADRPSGERPAAPARHPFIGCLKGTVHIPPGVDLTEPADPDWADSLEK